MTRLALWSLALALSGALWLAILARFGWWFAAALAYLYLLGFASVACLHGWSAFVRWLDWRTRG